MLQHKEGVLYHLLQMQSPTGLFPEVGWTALPLLTWAVRLPTCEVVLHLQLLRRAGLTLWAAQLLWWAPRIGHTACGGGVQNWPAIVQLTTMCDAAGFG